MGECAGGGVGLQDTDVVDVRDGVVEVDCVLGPNGSTSGFGFDGLRIQLERAGSANVAWVFVGVVLPAGVFVVVVFEGVLVGVVLTGVFVGLGVVVTIAGEGVGDHHAAVERSALPSSGSTEIDALRFGRRPECRRESCSLCGFILLVPVFCDVKKPKAHIN